MKAWNRADNYIGKDYSDWFVAATQHRDSQILEQSNFACALERLGGEVDGKVQVIRSGHWAVGWVEQVLVHKSAKKELKELSKIESELRDYPVLDEDDFSERESEYYSEFANGVKKDTAEALSKHFKIKLTKKLIDIAYQLQVEAQYQGGEDSCLNIYTQREPDQREVERLARYIDDVEYNYGAENSRVLKALKNSVAVYRLRFLEVKGESK